MSEKNALVLECLHQVRSWLMEQERDYDAGCILDGINVIERLQVVARELADALEEFDK
jgi:hypothetical protein